MPTETDIAIGQELLNVPMGDMIKQMAFAIADAQFELDESSIRSAELMSGRMTERDDDGNIVYRLENGTGAIAEKDPTTGAWPSGAKPGFISTLVQFGTTTTIVTPGTPSDPGDPDADPPVATPAVPPVFTVTPSLVSMFELGFSPTFYQFVDTIIEVKIAIKITRDTSFELKAGFTATTAATSNSTPRFTSRRRSNTKQKSSSTTVCAHVDATYSSKFSYSAEGSSLLRTKLVPVPPPAVFEERVRALMNERAALLAATPA